MVPHELRQIPPAACNALDVLLERLERDRESLAQSGYGDAARGMALLNALADAADELKRAFVAENELETKVDEKQSLE